MFAVERIKLNLQEPELFELLDLSVRDQGVSGEQSQSLEVVAVLGEELNSFNVLPTVCDRQADKILGLSSCYLQQQSCIGSPGFLGKISLKFSGPVSATCGSNPGIYNSDRHSRGRRNTKTQILKLNLRVGCS